MRVLKNERLEKEVLLSISKNDLLRDVQAELLSQSHQVKKHGFRSGKIPATILFQERGGPAIDAVVHKAVLNAFSDIVGDRNLGAPLGYTIETSLQGASLDNLSDIDVRVHAVFAPEIGEVTWKDIVLDHYVPHPTDEEIDANVSERAQRVMTSVPLMEKRPAALGDTLAYTMTYTHKDGSVKEVDGAFQLGSNTLPEEFEKTLEGITEGHVLSESLRVPKDFPDKSLAGKKVNFSIAFHEIRETVPHQPNEEFAKSQGFENLEAVRDVARKSLVESGEVLSDLLLRNNLKEKLGQVESFDVPDSWVQTSLESLKKSYLKAMVSKDAANSDLKSMESDSESDSHVSSVPSAVLDSAAEKNLLEKAERIVRSNCIVQKIIREQQFSVKDSELLGYARAMAQSEGKSIDDVVGFLRRNKSMVDRISEDIQERKALLWISNQCTKEDKEISFHALKDLFNQVSL
jgi:trigger factor